MSSSPHFCCGLRHLEAPLPQSGRAGVALRLKNKWAWERRYFSRCDREHCQASLGNRFRPVFSLVCQIHRCLPQCCTACDFVFCYRIGKADTSLVVIDHWQGSLVDRFGPGCSSVCQIPYVTSKQSKAKQSKAKQSKAKQCKSKQSKAMQSKAKQSKLKQCKAMQSKAKRSKAKQIKAMQSKAKQSNIMPVSP